MKRLIEFEVGLLGAQAVMFDANLVADGIVERGGDD